MTPTTIDRYEVVKVLGRGAMGVVYLARDPIIDRQLAVKTLRVDLDAQLADEFSERFMREARAAGRLNHAGIVTIHDVGEDAAHGTVFIAMEFIEGRDLKGIMDDGYQFRPAEAARIVADVAVALDYAHSMGVVHRDIKPANIILTKDGTPKIMDFGVARLESSNLTVEGQFIGTPNFMSPEQITGNPVDGRSDLFSLGVLLFNMLTGQRPFSGANIHEVTHKIVSSPSPIPSVIAPGLPPAFNPIVLKCLQKDPDKRFQSGREVARVLAALANSLVVRDEADLGSTAVVSPDLITRIAVPCDDEPTAPPTAVAVAAAPAPVTAPTLVMPAASSGRAFSPNTAAIRRPELSAKRPPPALALLLAHLLARLPLPPVLLQEVNLRWVTMIVAGWTVAAAAVVGALALKLESGPFPAPPDAAVAAVHRTAASFRAASQLLAAGRVEEADRACRAGLDQAPSSLAGRRLATQIHHRLAVTQTSASTAARLEELLRDGRQRYRDGSLRTAGDRFREALELDPDNEVAVNFLDLIAERSRRPSSTTATTTPLLPARPTPAATRPAAATTPRATPAAVTGQARLTLFFDSPLNQGEVIVTLDGSPLAQVPFDFTKKLMGIKKKGTGQVKKVLTVPAGRHRLDVELRDAETGSRGSKAFQGTFAADSEWTLRVGLASADGTPDFFLVQPSR